MTTKQVAQLLCTSDQVIRQSRVDGKLFGRPAPLHKRIGNYKILYEVEEIERYIKQSETRRVT